MLYPSVLFPGKTQYDESKDLVFSFENKRLFSSLNPFSWVRTANEIKKLNLHSSWDVHERQCAH